MCILRGSLLNTELARTIGFLRYRYRFLCTYIVIGISSIALEIACSFSGRGSLRPGPGSSWLTSIGVYGFGIMSGIRHATGEVLSWTHADLQTDPADVLAAYDRFAREREMSRCFLKGRRIGRNPLDAFFTFGMSVVSSLTLGQWLSDINAQPKMFHRSFLGQMTEPPDDFSLDLYVLYLARKLGLNILEQPVHFGGRTYGQAKGGGTLKGKIRLTKRSWKYILELRRKLT